MVPMPVVRIQKPTHARSSRRTGAGDVVQTRAKVFDDGASAALDGEDAGELANDILGGAPLGELAGELDADDLGGLELPWEAGHDVDGIGATDAHGAGTQTAGVGGVGVGADDHDAGVGIVFEDDLVDDAAAGLPEADAILGAGGCQKVVHFLVGGQRVLEIGLTTKLAAAVLSVRNDELSIITCASQRTGHLEVRWCPR